MDDLFVSVDWLKANLDRPDVRAIDGSWNMPGEPKANISYQAAHIPDAIFFDIDEIASENENLPHMAPTPDRFSEAMEQLGVSQQDHVVLYDQKGLFSVARVWWTFKLMNHKHISILSGGLPAWIENGYPTSSNTFSPTRSSYSFPEMRPLLADLSDIKHAIRTKKSAIVDARPANRFAGLVDEPRAGLRKGRMPTAVNLPFQDVLVDGQLKPADELKKLFAKIGVDDRTPIITTCGSGVTAAIIFLALHHTGHENVKLYDGSWAEWGDMNNDPGICPVVVQEA